MVCDTCKKPISNADIIRAMTDEELANFIARQRFCMIDAIADEFGINLSPSTLFLTCCKNMLNWLKQEAERSEDGKDKI